MKKFYFFMLALFLCSTVNAQETFYSWDFETGIPKDFALYDVDQNVPSSTAKQYGFDVDKSWIPIKLNSGAINAIASHSLYTPTGTSNDWIVTPAIEVKSPDAYFTWIAANMNDNLKGGYKILISTSGQTPDDFENAAVLYQTTTGEQAAGYLFEHAVSLKEYHNQTVYIAVINNSTNKDLLIMDDFKVTEIFEEVLLINATQNVIDGTPNSYIISCILVNPKLIDFKQNVDVTLTIGGETYTKSLSPLSLAYGKYQQVNFANVTPVPAAGESANYTIKATYTIPSQEETVLTINSALNCPGSTYSRKVVIEEGTGTWCPYCPRGAVGMKSMREKYPDDFIGIAVHCGDIMQVDEYYYGISNHISGYPEGTVNRSASTNMTFSSCESQYKKALATPSIASLKITNAEFTSQDSTAVKVQISSQFAFNTDRGSNNFNFAFVVIENGVKGTTAAYDQANAFSKGSPMGGFEKLPNPVPASQMVYEEVARDIVDSFYGINNSVPQEIVKDQEYTYEYTINLPNTIMKKRNIEIIALLLDNTTEVIWNADKYTMDSTTGIETVKVSNNSSMKLYVAGGDLLIAINSETTAPAHVEIYGLDGKKVKEERFNNVLDGISIPVGNLTGTYIVKVSNGKDVIVEKVIL